jgi:hypothetical protein
MFEESTDNGLTWTEIAASSSYHEEDDVKYMRDTSHGAYVEFVWSNPTLPQPTQHPRTGNGYATVIATNVYISRLNDDGNQDEVYFVVGSALSEQERVPHSTGTAYWIMKLGHNLGPDGNGYVLYDGRIGNRRYIPIRVMEDDSTVFGVDDVIGTFDLDIKNLVWPDGALETIFSAGQNCTITNVGKHGRATFKLTGDDARYSVSVMVVNEAPTSLRRRMFSNPARNQRRGPQGNHVGLAKYMIAVSALLGIMGLAWWHAESRSHKRG